MRKFGPTVASWSHRNRLSYELDPLLGQQPFGQLSRPLYYALHTYQVRDTLVQTLEGR